MKTLIFLGELINTRNIWLNSCYWQNAFNNWLRTFVSVRDTSLVSHHHHQIIMLSWGSDRQALMNLKIRKRSWSGSLAVAIMCVIYFYIHKGAWQLTARQSRKRTRLPRLILQTCRLYTNMYVMYSTYLKFENARVSARKPYGGWFFFLGDPKNPIFVGSRWIFFAVAIIASNKLIFFEIFPIKGRVGLKWSHKFGNTL
jgi:hypothetical protein